MKDEELRPVNRRLRIAILSVVALVAVLTVAVTSEKSKDTTTGGSSGVPGSTTPGHPTDGKRTASDQGVTADEVHIATFTIAQAFLDRYRYSNPEIDRSVPAYVDAINARGGINGRRWVPDLIEVADPTDSSIVAQACRSAFVDHKDFAVVNALAYPGLAECAKKYGRVATDLGYGGVTSTSAELLRRLDGHYWIGGMSSDRLTALWAKQLAADVGTDTRIAIIQRQDPQLELARRQLSRALVRLGFPEPLVITTSSDSATAAIQISDGVARVRQDKVQLLIPLLPAIGVSIIQNGFANTGFRPPKGFSYSTISGLDSADVTRFYVKSQMNGARGVSLFRGPDEPQQRRCRKVFETAEPSLTFQQANADMCQMITQLAEAMTAAGPDLTTRSLIAGYATLGARSGNSLGTQTYSTTKRDGADQVRVIEFRDGATRPVGPFRSDFGSRSGSTTTTAP